MSFKSLFLFFLCLPLLIFSQNKEIKIGQLHLSLNAKGDIESLSDKKTLQQYLYKDTTTALISLVKDKKKYLPNTLTWINASTFELNFDNIITKIHIQYIEKSDYALFEIIHIDHESEIDAVIWGPIPVTINKTVGEVIGVVRDDNISIGLQVLNTKTLGGDYPNSEGSTWERGIASYKRSWGSTMQAYCINRNKDRKVDAWGGNFKDMPVEAIKEGTVVGSKIALFSCESSKTLDQIEKIELGESLPHPTIDGIWYKRSKYFGRSYMISSFGENEMDEMIQYVKKAGLFSLYHEGPFQSWGHFILDSLQFPNGRKSLQHMAKKAHDAGLKIGVHTLTNFINTNDPYVTPIPDSRLSNTGSSILIKDMDEHALEIAVAASDYFMDSLNNNLHTIRIGKELIRYKKISNSHPFVLSGLERGAFGTHISYHIKGDSIFKLLDHPYNVFFPDFELNKEIAGNLSTLLNETGVDHIDFDGFEGGLGTGQGDFGVETFAKEVYDKMEHPLINGTSISKSFYWHIGSYYNWGEPWYGGFRESMQQYRIDNQGLFERNFMPHMMGWYLMTENTTLSEMEWMLARAAGYNAGFAMVARPSALRKNPNTNTLLNAIREWEHARTNNAFNEELRNRMKDPKNEFHLEKISDYHWNLSCFNKTKEFQITKKTDTISFHHNWITGYPSLFIRSISDSVVTNSLTLDFGSKEIIQIKTELLPGQYLMSEGANTILKYDSNGRMKERINVDHKIPIISKNDFKIIIHTECLAESNPSLEMHLKGIEQIIPVNIHR